MVQPDKHLSLLRAIGAAFYVMAVASLVIGALMALSLANGAAAIPGVTLGLQSVTLKPLWDLLVSGLKVIGGMVFLGSVVTSALLAVCGLLLSRSVRLTERVQAVEAELARLAAPAAAANNMPAPRPAPSAMKAQ